MVFSAFFRRAARGASTAGRRGMASNKVRGWNVGGARVRLLPLHQRTPAEGRCRRDQSMLTTRFPYRCAGRGVHEAWRRGGACGARCRQVVPAQICFSTVNATATGLPAPAHPVRSVANLNTPLCTAGAKHPVPKTRARRAEAQVRPRRDPAGASPAPSSCPLCPAAVRCAPAGLTSACPPCPTRAGRRHEHLRV